MAQIMARSMSGISGHTTTEGKGSSKCLVYTLGGFVTVLGVWLVFASIALHMGDPKIELRSPKFIHSNNYFNLIMISRVTLTNPNLGRFYYGNGTVSVLYGAKSVGAWKLEGSRMEARETKEIDFTVHMRSTKLLRNSGMLKLRIYAKLNGTVHVLNMVNKRKTIVMACIMNLNFTSYSINRFQC